VKRTVPLKERHLQHGSAEIPIRPRRCREPVGRCAFVRLPAPAADVALTRRPQPAPPAAPPSIVAVSRGKWQLCYWLCNALSFIAAATAIGGAPQGALFYGGIVGASFYFAAWWPLLVGIAAGVFLRRVFAMGARLEARDRSMGHSAWESD
jgi:hypothetical protein